MGSGTGEVSTPGALPKALQPPPAPDLTDEEILSARRAAMRSLAAKRGLQSTFLTTQSIGPAATGPGIGDPMAGRGTPGSS